MERASVIAVAGGLTRWLRIRVVQARTNAPPWHCVDCQAANHPASLECCHGCGDRALLEVIERPVAAPASAPAIRRA